MLLCMMKSSNILLVTVASCSFASLRATASAASVPKDTPLDEDFCPMYYWGSGDCDALKKQVKFNHSRPAPTLELGDPSNPVMFFFHGWPDTAALWVNQFEHFCAPPHGKFFCVAPTWMNFHPDFPDAPKEDLYHDVQVSRMYGVAKEMGLNDITLVIFDWGAHLGYEFVYRYPELVKVVVAFDIGMNIAAPSRAYGDAEIPTLPQYQQANIKAYRANDFAPMQPTKDLLMKTMWRGHDPKFFSQRTGWPYNCIVLNGTGEDMNERFAPKIPLNEWKFDTTPAFPNGKPVLFLYGKCTDGSGCDRCPLGKTCIPRTMQFHTRAFEDWVNTRPGSAVVAVDGAGHWMMTQQSAFVNEKIEKWLQASASSLMIAV